MTHSHPVSWNSVTRSILGLAGGDVKSAGPLVYVLEVSVHLYEPRGLDSGIGERNGVVEKKETKE
jgi:hypothetical protein